ncbi:MAG: lipoyl(octanoyl) transferase LipB [Chloroflexi bacterium]|nr:lipoyl(octanoyl) transferase LipB [Chloroflexota bacterium]
MGRDKDNRTERVCEVRQLGRVAYGDAWDVQNQLAEARGQGGVDTLLLLEHPPTYTLGSSGDAKHLLLTPAQLAAHGIPVQRVDRGGDITYHGPGQRVGYPIMQLERSAGRGGLRTDVIGYIRKLEQVIIQTIRSYGISGHAIPGLTGVWVATPRGPEKIAAIGVKINVKAVTKHGFALNINTDLSAFDGIIPCGISDKGVTSLAALLGKPVDEAEVTGRLIAAFGAIFNRTMITRAE